MYCQMTPELQQLTPKTVKCKSPMPASAFMKFSISYNIPLTLTPFQLSVSINSLTDRQTDGWTDEQTYGRRKDRQTVGQTERERGIEE